MAVGGWWRLAADGVWQLVVVGGWWLAVGGWWLLAVGGWWSLKAVLNKNKERKIGVLKESPGLGHRAERTVLWQKQIGTCL